MLLGADQPHNLPLHVLLHLTIPKNEVMQIALFIKGGAGSRGTIYTWRVMIFRDSSETFVHLEDDAEEHRQLIAQIIEDLKTALCIEDFIVHTFIAWSQQDTPELRERWDGFRPQYTARATAQLPAGQ